MNNKLKNIIIITSFIIILSLFCVINIIMPDEKISKYERRNLKQFPEISINNIFTGNIAKEFEEYAMDQFVGREFFREIKQFINVNFLKSKDNNKFFIKDNSIYKMEYPLNEENVKRSAVKIKKVQERYLNDNNIYYAIIPDKNYYLKNDEHLKMDYMKLKKIMNDNLPNMEYIDIWSELNVEDYYRTDLHWRQEKLQGVVNTIEKHMKLKQSNFQIYNINSIGDFYGVYYGQVSSEVEPDDMYILKSSMLDKCTTYDIVNLRESSIYSETSTLDKYDIFVSGAVPIITIENPNNNNERELLLFRDSFGSSISPLFMENYSKVTLIDIRYISSDLLERYIEFKNKDVLFLYSTTILNQNIFK